MGSTVEGKGRAVFGDRSFRLGTTRNLDSGQLTSPSETYLSEGFLHSKTALIREKTALIFSEYSILPSIGLSGAKSTLKITANSTYWEAKLKGAGGVARSKGKEGLFSGSIIPARDLW
jgi:hypothetical protein